MKTLSLTNKIISATELRRNFGKITKKLPKLDSLIITKGGKPFAILKAAPAKKRELLIKAAGAWENTSLDNNKLWEEVREKESRKEPIDL